MTLLLDTVKGKFPRGLERADAGAKNQDCAEHREDNSSNYACANIHVKDYSMWVMIVIATRRSLKVRRSSINSKLFTCTAPHLPDLLSKSREMPGNTARHTLALGASVGEYRQKTTLLQRHVMVYGVAIMSGTLRVIRGSTHNARSPDAGPSERTVSTKRTSCPARGLRSRSTVK